MVLDEVDAIRSDGGLVHIRQIQPSDRDGLLELNARSSDQSLYRRFFHLSRYAADIYVARLLQPATVEHQALVASVGDSLIGVGSFERVDSESAEIALLIDDRDQHQGIGTLLMEHLADLARRIGYRTFVADVLADNLPMIQAIRRLGFHIASSSDHGVFEMRFDLEQTSQVVAAIDDRDRAADAASLSPLLAPRSLAVIGASTRPQSVGHEVLRNILRAGFTGDVYVVNPHHDAVLGIASVPSANALPIAPDLAIVAVPSTAVVDVVRACGKRGVRGILLLTAGFGESGATGKALQQDVLAIARYYGMRLIGPNCLGLLNTDPGVSLNATFAPLPMQAGHLGLVSQSGALGIAVLSAARTCGLGVSQFVSVGNKADVSGNDLLLAWERDARTSVIALYLESFGNPRKFARIARRVSRTKPIIAIKSGRSLAGQRAGQSHTAAAASADSVVDALFSQAGVVRVDGMEQMLDLARLLSNQPVPAGRRIAIVGNSGGPGILAADAAEAAGLEVVELTESTVGLLRDAVPSAASPQNPVDLGAGAQPAEAAAAVRILLEAGEVDAVLTVFTETLVADPVEVMSAVVAATEGSTKTVAATEVGGQARSVPVTGTTRAVPVYAFPEPAARAIGYACQYAKIRSAVIVDHARPSGIAAEAARVLVNERVAAGAGWLGPRDTDDLLGYYGISVCQQRVARDVDAALAAARELGYPVAVKIGGGVVHKTDVGGVRVGITDESRLRTAFEDVRAAGSGVDGGSDVIVQQMVGEGTELIAGAVQDAQFGPVIMLGAGGVLADLIADRQFRLAPVTSAAADEMIASLRCAPLLDGYRGRTPVSRSALQTLVLRLAALAEDLPEVAELDLNPVICRGEDLVVVDAKIRVAVAGSVPDPVLRQLRQ